MKRNRRPALCGGGLRRAPEPGAVRPVVVGGGLWWWEAACFKAPFAVWLNIFVPGDKWKASISPLCCDSVRGEGRTYSP